MCQNQSLHLRTGDSISGADGTGIVDHDHDGLAGLPRRLAAPAESPGLGETAGGDQLHWRLERALASAWISAGGSLGRMVGSAKKGAVLIAQLLENRKACEAA